mgnify:CR=1 FL=1
MTRIYFLAPTCSLEAGDRGGNVTASVGTVLSKTACMSVIHGATLISLGEEETEDLGVLGTPSGPSGFDKIDTAALTHPTPKKQIKFDVAAPKEISDPAVRDYALKTEAFKRDTEKVVNNLAGNLHLVQASVGITPTRHKEL